MRLWSLHPRYLDTKGLLAGWREALLAQAVIRGQTRGYRQHPQLQRFLEQPSPRYAINAFLHHLHQESERRGYRFDRSKVGPVSAVTVPIEVSDGQLDYEWHHLRAKLAVRDPQRLHTYSEIARPDPHPLFVIVPGTVADWEKR